MSDGKNPGRSSMTSEEHRLYWENKNKWLRDLLSGIKLPAPGPKQPKDSEYAEMVKFIEETRQDGRASYEKRTPQEIDKYWKLAEKSGYIQPGDRKAIWDSYNEDVQSGRLTPAQRDSAVEAESRGLLPSQQKIATGGPQAPQSPYGTPSSTLSTPSYRQGLEAAWKSGDFSQAPDFEMYRSLGQKAHAEYQKDLKWYEQQKAIHAQRQADSKKRP